MARKADPLSLVDAVKSTDRRVQLEAIRDALAVVLTSAEGSAAAAVAKQLRDTLAELRSLPPAREVPKVDQVAAARAKRGAPNLGSPSKRGLVPQRSGGDRAS